MLVFRVVPVLAAVWLLIGPNVRQNVRADAEGLNRALIAHQSARESIRTVQANFRVEFVHPKAEVVGTGTYLRTPDGTLIRSGKEGETAIDTLYAGGQSRTVARAWRKGKDQVQYNASIAPVTQSYGLLDMWQRLLLSNYGSNLQTMPLEQFVDTATDRPKLKLSRKDGRSLAIVSFPIGSGNESRRLDFELDSQVNYLVRRSTVTHPSAGYSQAEILEFFEPQPGVFMPVKCRARSYKGDELTQESLYSLTDVAVNIEISKEKLKLPSMPSGTLVADRIQGTQYPVDSSWVQIGPSKPNPIIKVGAPAKEFAEFTTQSVDEPTSWSAKITYVFGALLGAAILAWLLMRWRRSKVASSPSAGPAT